MMSLALAAQILSLPAPSADLSLGSISTDSRRTLRGALFVALRGERFDGHAFIDSVAQAGAAAAMVDRAWNPPAAGAALPLLVVDDTRVALGGLAAGWRAGFRFPLIAVAGSNGKTTVKEMIASILREHFGAEQVLATEGNLNNDIGLPLTLLRLRAGHQAAVVEVGMNHPGETARLAAMARPSIALVNNAQREHQEFMKSVAEVAREHAALITALPSGGIAVFNAEDAHAGLWRDAARLAGASVRDFGLDPAAAVSTHCSFKPFSSEMQVRTPEGTARFELPLPGLHNVRNALAAIAAASAAGASLEAAIQALARFSALRGRMQQRPGRSGAVLIDDSYNANPESVHAAIEVLAACPEPRVLVLGDMGEVGEQGPAFHAEVGEHARRAQLTSLLALGEQTRHAVKAFGGGLHTASLAELLQALRPWDRAGATLLVKGSRFMRMERVIEALAATNAATNADKEAH